MIVRVAPGVHWHALEDDVVGGRGHALRRPDGRVYLGVDTWRDDVFHQLVDAMAADLAPPLRTVVDHDDREMLDRWLTAGFRVHRREREYAVPTDPRVTGLDRSAPPPGVAVLPVGLAEEGALRALDRDLREEIAASVGWETMPVELFPGPDGRPGVADPSRYAVALLDGVAVGLARVAPLPRRPRLGLLAVRAAHRRRGIARAILAEVLSALHEDGVTTVGADVDERNAPALALVEGLGGRPVGGAAELVLPAPRA